MTKGDLSCVSAITMKRRALSYAAACVVFCLLDEEKEREEEERRQRKRSKWCREMFLLREEQGAFAKLNGFMRRDPELFFNFLRLYEDEFDYLVDLVTPHIQKENTNYRKSISAAERLAITIRYLATGDSYASLMFLFHVSKAAIHSIIEETCTTIFEVLNSLSVSVSLSNSVSLMTNN